MTNTGKLLTGVAIGAVAIFALVTLIDVDVTGDVEVPSIEMSGGDIELPEIETSAGNMPAVDVNTADVDFGTTQKQIEVPTDIDVQTESRSVTVPTMEFTAPEENKYAEENDLN